MSGISIVIPVYNVEKYLKRCVESVLVQEWHNYDILLVDDINDSGATLNWLKKDWEAGCFPDEQSWSTVWHETVKFSTIVNNESSSFKEVDYTYETINKLETPDIWLDFPWESWWLD